MVKKYFIFFYFVFLVSLSSAATLTMGPQQLDFIGEAGETICETAFLKLDGSDTVSGKVLFAENGYSERKLTRHNLSGDDVGIKVDFPSEILVEDKSEIEICINGKRGNYHGVVLYKIKSKPIQVGIWMNVSLEKGLKNSLMRISGNSVATESDGFSSGFFITPLILLGILGLLYYRMKKKDSLEVYDY